MKKPLHHHLSDYFFPHPRNNHRPNIFSALSVAALVFAVVIFEAGYLVQTKIVFLKTDFLASVLPSALVALTNQDRATEGLAGVTEDALLNKAAQAAALDMAAKGYFAHVSPDGKTPWYWLDQVGYSYSYAGENLAVNFTDSENVETAWMASPTHRANIMRPQYTRVGFGTANGMYEGKETTFVVQFFATPAVAKVAVAPVSVAQVSPPIATAKPTPATTTSIKVLGIETTESPAAPASSGWLAGLLSSPLNTLAIILTVLLALIAIPFIVTVFIRGRVQHPSMAFGAVFLFVFISATLLVSVTLAGPVMLTADGQAASIMALPR